MKTSEYMEAAGEVAHIASANAMLYYRTAVDTDLKQDRSPVTIADLSSEQLAREWIENRFPSDGILGEEYGTVRADAVRRWIIDPIDGTRAFVRGVPFWGTLVAVLEGDTVMAGAASYPALDEFLVAGLGEGAWWNESRCAASKVDDLSSATVLATDARFKDDPVKLERWLALAARAGMSRTWGDCVGYLLVATGRAEVMVDPIVSAWDIAALMPAIVEAGGVFTDWEGKSVCGTSAIATNAALGDVVRDILIPRTGAQQR
ncbi:MAG TPA: inositol monophosphatase family protein [Gemmatimonadaceae bacterium]|jgi:histidinol phosphatase-like enzyme (inositol monophosphatase family)